MVSAKLKWARGELSKRLKQAKNKAERKAAFKSVWAEAKRKFGGIKDEGN